MPEIASPAKVVHPHLIDPDADASRPAVPGRGEDTAAGVIRFALIVAAIFTLTMLGTELAKLWLGDTADATLPFGGPSMLLVGLVFFALGVAALAHYRRRPAVVLTAASLLFVAQGAVAAWFQAGALTRPSMVALRPSWGAVLVLLFALLVTGPQLLHFGLLLLNGLATPLVLATLIVTGQARGPHPPPQLAKRMVIGQGATWICTVIAAALVIHRERERRRLSALTKQLATARHELQEFGSYQLERRLGLGDMGEVWQATHRTLARPAAIKLVSTQELEQQLRSPAEVERTLARFQQEAKLSARLTSPHTVQVLDFGRTDEGHLYYVTELLHGVNLCRLLRQLGPQPANRVVPWLLQVCDSLAEAHSLGLVHRDLKPDSLFLCRQGLHHEGIKVLNFGLALVSSTKTCRPLDAALKETAQPDDASAFRAPEQARDDAEPDGRADLYSLGCVGWFLLTGELVGPSRAAENASPESSRPVRLTPPAGIKIEPRLTALLQWLLAPERDDRPASADEVAASLRNLGIVAATGSLLDEIEPSGGSDFLGSQTFIMTRRLPKKG